MGLLPNDLWQRDVTHISDFGKLKYVHVTIDTFSGFIMATLQSGEASKHCIQHCLWSFSTMGLPKCIKTDNGPGYVGRNFQTFCAQLHIVHKTGIPYKPQGQGIVEQAHQTLQHQFKKLKRGSLYAITPNNLLRHALFF